MTMEKRLTLEKLPVEKLKAETQEKFSIMNETGNNYKMKGKINSVILRRLELKKFDGNILKWQEFWNLLESTM